LQVFGSYLRPIAAIAALAGLSAYATIMLRGPQGLSALSEKHREIRALEKENADLQRDIDAKRQRIERLKHDPNTQEVEVRKQLKLGRTNEVHYVLPESHSNPVSSDTQKSQ
jgi:cell division protein FtsB